MKAISSKRKRRVSESLTSLEGQVSRLASEGKLDGAARGAIRAARGQGLPITFKRGNRVIRQHSDGREEVLEQLAPRLRVKPRRGVKLLGNK